MEKVVANTHSKKRDIQKGETLTTHAVLPKQWSSEDLTPP